MRVSVLSQEQQRLGEYIVDEIYSRTSGRGSVECVKNYPEMFILLEIYGQKKGRHGRIVESHIFRSSSISLRRWRLGPMFSCVVAIAV